MAGKEEHREFKGVPIRVWVEVRAGDCVIKTHESHDLSMTGISLKQHVIFRFFWKELNLPIHLDMKRRVGRSNEQELTVEFSELYFSINI